MFAGGVDQAIGDLDVHVVEGISGLVEVVVCGRVGNEMSRGMHRGAQMPVGDAVDGDACLIGDVLCAALTATANNDAGRGVG